MKLTLHSANKLVSTSLGRLKLAALTVLATSLSAHASDPRPILDWEKRSAPGVEFDALSDGVFGDQIDPHLGGISFSVVDLSLPGNFDLPVEIRRTLRQGRKYHATETAAFGDWELDVPHLSLSYIGDAPAQPRCSTKAKDRFEKKLISISQGPGEFRYIRVEPQDYGADLMLHVGGGSEYLADRREAGGSDGDFFPSNATHATKSNWYFTCIPAKNGTEGFLGHAPDGSKYYFDKVIEKRGTSPFRAKRTWGNLNPNGEAERSITSVSLMATKVEDRNGNYVNYNYTAEPFTTGRLSSIEASDGRSIWINYFPDIPFFPGFSTHPNFADRPNMIESIRTHRNRTWRYSYKATDFEFEPWERDESYGDIPLPSLQKVQLPDGKYWEYDLDGMMASGSPTDKCNRFLETYTIKVKHPQGAELRVRLREKFHRMSSKDRHKIYKFCHSYLLDFSYDIKAFDVAHVAKMSVEEKVIDIGPQEYKWSYTYENDIYGRSESHSNQVNTTVVVGPTKRTVYEHFWAELSGSNDNGDGQIAKVETRDRASNALLESTSYEWYRERPIGFIFADRNFNGRSPYSRLALPKRKTVKRYSGSSYDTYTTDYYYNSTHGSSLYSFGRPTRITKGTSVTGGGHLTVMTYETKRSPWVVALPKTETRNNRQIKRNDYDSRGRLSHTYEYGARVASYTYHTAAGQKGAVRTVKDGINRLTRYDDWHRGIPETVTQADGRKIYTGVDDFGLVGSVKNARGHRTQYTYDPMGRLKTITPPSPFTATSIDYSFPSSGGIIQTSNRGSSRKTITYDALLRPRLEHNQSRDTGWSSYVAKRYDGGNRMTFQSFPSTSSNPTQGTDFTYDSLDRLTRSRENVSPYATTSVTFSTNNSQTVKDPDGFNVKTWRYGWDEPGAGPTRAIYRYGGNSGTEKTFTYHNVFGELTRTRRLASGGSSERNQYQYYDSRSRLCRMRTDEGGDTLYAYNNANELIAWSKGHGAGSTCSTPSGSYKVTQTYDPMGRPLFTNYADSATPDTRRTYDEDGNLRTLNRGSGSAAVNWTYTYDQIDNLKSEILSLDGLSFSNTYTYNNDGNLITRKLPSGETVTYDRSAVGQMKDVKIAGARLANNFNFHPSGDVASMRFNNGQSFTQTLTPRQQPLRLRSIKSGGATALDLTHVYNKRGLVTSITDRAVTGQNRTFGYDGLARLVSTTGPWGNGSYSYDGVGNLRNKMLGSRRVSLTYDSKNRVTKSTDTGESGIRNIRYDSRGNTTSLGGLSFVYDASDRAVSVIGIVGGTVTPPPTPPIIPPVTDPPPRVICDPICRIEDDDLWLRSGREDNSLTPLKLSPYTAGSSTGTKASPPVTVNTKPSPSVNLTYRYDGHGRRVKAVSSNATIYNVFDASGRLVYVEKRDGLGTKKTHYIDGPMGTLARVEGAGSGRKVTYLHADHLGSPQAGTNASGNVVWRELHTPFGEPSVRDAANDDQGTFTGHIRDRETDLLYMQARYMDPVMGRFLSVDPVTFWQTGSPQIFNRYSYAFNDPTNKTDPTGMCPWCVVIAAVWIADKAYAAYEAKQDYDAIQAGETTVGAVAGRRGTEHAAGWALGPLGRWGAKGVNRGVDAVRGVGNSRGSFSPRPNQNGGTVYVSDGLITSQEFAPIVHEAVENGSTVNILTGVHGTEMGGIVPEPKFFTEDVDQFGNLPNVNVLDMNKMSLDEINEVARGPDVTVGAFCFSGNASCMAVD